MFVDTYYVVGAVGPMANPISVVSDTISAARVNIQSRYNLHYPNFIILKQYAYYKWHKTPPL